jgi:hypothetical protein
MTENIFRIDQSTIAMVNIRKVLMQIFGAKNGVVRNKITAIQPG